MKTLLTGCMLILTLMAEGQHRERHGKTATVLLSNISLEEALTILSISYGVQFSYSDDRIPIDTNVNLAIEDEHLGQVLEKLLGPLGIGYKSMSGGRIVLKKHPLSLVQTIRGRVTDEVTGSGIPGAGVVLTGTVPLLGVTTDEQGNFRIVRVPLGRISLAFSSVGYNPQSINALLLSAGKELIVEVALRESIVPMNEVVITAAMHDGVAGDGLAFTSGRSFSVEDTKRYAGSLGDPARMASGFAGVTGASDENNALIVRGNSPRSVLWRIEGVEVPNPNHFATEGASHGLMSVVSPNIIEKSDFLTGAFPAQYGNALSAVFDLHLRNGNNEKTEYAVQAGLLGLEVSAEGPFIDNQAASWLVNYRYSTLSVLDKLGFGLTEAGQFKDYQDVAFKLNFPTSAGNFALFGIGGKSEANKSDTALLDNRTSDVGMMALTYSNTINSNIVINSALSLSGTDITTYSDTRSLDAGVLALQEQYAKSYARLSFSTRLKLTPSASVEGGIIGSRLRYDFFLRSVDSANPAYRVIFNFSDRGSSNIAQAYMLTRQQLSPILQLHGGAHLMYFHLTNDRSIEPRAGLQWDMTPRSSLAVAYGKHSRIENLQYYLGRDHVTGGDELQVNRNLGFTRAYHAVLSFTSALPLSHKFKAEMYYQRLYNSPVSADHESFYASVNEDTGFVTDSLINKGNGQNYGIELSLLRPYSGNVYYEVNGSLYRSLFSFDEQSSTGSAYNGNFTLHALAGKEFEVGPRARLEVNVKTTYAGGRRFVPIDLERSRVEGRQVPDWDRAFDEQLPNYFRADLQLAYRLNTPRSTMEWRLDIQNVSDHRNVAYYFYDTQSEFVRQKRQAGILPLITFRIEF